jgi:serine/threonine-protein kinase
VLITKYGEVKIVDFGLAKANTQLEKSEPGIIKGKFSYLAPEAAKGHEVDARADIFAIGIMLWEMLAGRRLFLGETDLDTVRQVQAARIPSLSQLNSEVTPELERIVQRALAREVSQRYQSARDLGRDLNTHLYRVGRPVSSFDIAVLVREAMVARESERRQKLKDDKVSIIGTLIDQAMVEFTSLEAPTKQSDGSVVAQKGSPTVGAAPLNLGSFEAVQDWGKEHAAPTIAARRSSLPADSFEAGNLAALEEDSEPPPAAPASPRPAASWPPPTSSSPPPAASPAAKAPAVPVDPDDDDDLPPLRKRSSGGSGALIAVVVVVMAAAGALGAYFGGLLH